jgi:hypothetical protein
MAFKKPAPKPAAEAAPQKQSAKGKVVNVGSVLQAKDDPERSYIKVNKDIALKEGQIINVQTPAERIAFFLERGFLTEEEAEQKLANTPDFVLFELTTRLEE